MKLLTQAHQNAKTAKNDQFDQYLSAILHLAPSSLSGFNACPAASNGCKASCLNTAGRGKFSAVQNARIRKTKLFFTNKSEFTRLLIKDIESLVKKAKKTNKIPVVRLNGTSDIDWENVEISDGLNIFDLFPSVQFYDYTKRPDRVILNDYPNYHLTFSVSECNFAIAQRLLQKGYNIAVVFSNIPEKYLGYSVINGDIHDLRFLEGNSGVIVGLKAKGSAKKDNTGFVKKIA